MGIWGYGDITIGKNMLKGKHKGHQKLQGLHN